MSDQSYDSIEARVSYGIGRNMGEQLAGNPFEGMQVQAVLNGLADALNGEPSPVAEADMRAAFEEISARMQAAEAEAAKTQGAEGEQFLAANAQRDEINTTASGLQYEVLVAGDGDKPGANDTVRTHYHGTLIDGTVFDSSYNRGEPIEFPLNGVIAGWTEALQLMPVGSKWRLFLPHQLGYGAQGAGGAIAPFSALIFEVELLAIVR